MTAAFGATGGCLFGFVLMTPAMGIITDRRPSFRRRLPLWGLHYAIDILPMLLSGALWLWP